MGSELLETDNLSNTVYLEIFPLGFRVIRDLSGSTNSYPTRPSANLHYTHPHVITHNTIYLQWPTRIKIQPKMITSRIIFKDFLFLDFLFLDFIRVNIVSTQGILCLNLKYLSHIDRKKLFCLFRGRKFLFVSTVFGHLSCIYQG